MSLALDSSGGQWATFQNDQLAFRIAAERAGGDKCCLIGRVNIFPGLCIVECQSVLRQRDQTAYALAKFRRATTCGANLLVTNNCHDRSVKEFSLFQAVSCGGFKLYLNIVIEAEDDGSEEQE